MAGHRKATGTPRRAVTRAAGQRKRLVQRLATAVSPPERVSHAADYLRARLARQDPAAAERIASMVVTYLVKVADELAPAPTTATPRRKGDHTDASVHHRP